MAYTYQNLEWPSKWPAEVLDYSINWKTAPATPDGATYTYIAVLDTANSETITTVTHAILEKPANDADNALTIDSEVRFDSNQQTTVWLSGGVTGTYVLTVTIVTSASRTIFRKINLKVL